MAAAIRRRSFVGRALEACVWVLVGLIIPIFITLVSSIAAVTIALAIGAAGIAILLGKVSIPGIRRARAIGLVWIAVMLPLAIVSVQLQREEEREHAEALAEMRVADPQHYLERIRLRGDDTFWLSEMRELDPSGFQEETERRLREAREATERRQSAAAETERERIARAEAGAAEVAERALQEFERALERAEVDIERPVTTPNSVQEIEAFLQRVARYSSVLSQAERLPLDNDAANRLGAFRNRLIAFQRREFPRIRDAVGPVFRRELWIDNGSARTIGPGYRTIEFTNPSYVLNRAIQADFQGLRETLLRLRFDEALFREHEGGSGSRYSLPTAPDDTEIAIWRGAVAVRLDAGEERPTRSGLTANRSGTIGRWSADCGVPCEITIEVLEAGEVVSFWTFPDGGELERPLSSPTPAGSSFRFEITDDTGASLGEYLIVTQEGDLTVFDRLGETMSGRLLTGPDLGMFDG
jgi:hypothetical protein